jgi:Heliorhodopsin
MDVVAAMVFLAQGPIFIGILFANNPSFTNQGMPVYNVVPLGVPWNDSTVYLPYPLMVVYPVWMVFAFSILTGIFHLFAAFLRLYTNDFVLWRSTLRWTEYSVTSTIMVVTIALMSGINTVQALVSIVGNNVVMILTGFLIDMALPSNYKLAMSAYIVGLIAGIMPWISIFASVGLIRDVASVPDIVLAITITLFLLFMSFGGVEFAYIWSFYPKKIIRKSRRSVEEDPLNYTPDQKKGIEPITFNDPRLVRREWGYIVLSFVAKTLLIWLTSGAFVFV